jgi:hypothetical protein
LDLPLELIVDGAENWYPPGPDARGSNADPAAVRYVLRVDAQSGDAEFREVDIRPINREDVTIGLGVMQGVYTIALILGLTKALEASYAVIVHPLAEPRRQLGHPVLLLALSTILVLGMRFFWVTRNLYALVILESPSAPKGVKKQIAAMVRYHFTIVLAHAVLFFVLCDTFVAMVQADTMAVEGRINRFISLTVLLLALNGVWLLVTFLRKDIPVPYTRRREQPVVIWGVSNLAFAALALAWRLLYHPLGPSPTVVLIAACAVFLLNSIVDLAGTADAYVFFPGAPLPR